MKSFKRYAAALIVATSLIMSGCATLGESNQERILFQYATYKLIENSSSFTAEGVIEKVAEIRAVVDGQVVIDPASLVDNVLQSVPPAERFLVQAFLVELEYHVLTAELPADQRVRLNNVLDWVEQAARLVQ